MSSSEAESCLRIDCSSDTDLEENELPICYSVGGPARVPVAVSGATKSAAIQVQETEEAESPAAEDPVAQKLQEAADHAVAQFKTLAYSHRDLASEVIYLGKRLRISKEEDQGEIKKLKLDLGDKVELIESLECDLGRHEKLVEEQKKKIADQLSTIRSLNAKTARASKMHAKMWESVEEKIREMASDLTATGGD